MTTMEQWITQLELWENQLEDQMKELLKESGPTLDGTSAHDRTTARHSEHSTAAQRELPPIRITKSTKRLIPEGNYEALCVKADYRWRYQFKRWEAMLYFAFESPVPAGEPIPMHVRMVDGPEPELKEDHWLAQLIERFGGLENLAGWRFFVTVETIKGPQGYKVARPESQWYSRVTYAELWDDHVTRQSNSLSQTLSLKTKPS